MLLDAANRSGAWVRGEHLDQVNASLRALAEAGLNVPHDVAIVGFDDIPAASLTSPPLTTIMQDMKGAGELLVDTVLAQVEERPLPRTTLPARLVVRRSSAG